MLKKSLSEVLLPVAQHHQMPDTTPGNLRVAFEEGLPKLVNPVGV
jgi:hypothetical protein